MKTPVSKRRGGTFVPARAEQVVPALHAQALREQIEGLVLLLGRMTGQPWRLTRLDLPSGVCADCGSHVTGDRCPHCRTPARTNRGRA